MSLPQTLLRRDLVRWLEKVDRKGWVANHDGNATLRLEAGRLLATPTAFSKGEIREDDLLVLDAKGKVVQGRHKVFSEIDLHLRALALRPDASVVLHAHPPTATGFAVAGVEVEPRMIAEAVVSLGDRIPVAPYAMPGTQAAVDALDGLLPWYDVVLLGNHGVLAVGKDVEQAFLRLELVEHLARIQQSALQLGRVTTIPAEDVDRLLAKRAKGGLGPEARGLGRSPEAKQGMRTVVGPCSGPRQIPADPTTPAAPPSTPLADVIAREVRAVLT